MPTARCDLHNAVKNGDLSEVIKLIGKGEDMCAKQRGKTPLHLAANHGYEDIVQSFLQAGVDPDIQDSNGLTALFLAVEEKHVEVVRMLLTGGAETHVKNKAGASLLKVARDTHDKEIIKLVTEQATGASWLPTSLPSMNFDEVLSNNFERASARLNRADDNLKSYVNKQIDAVRIQYFAGKRILGEVVHAAVRCLDRCCEEPERETWANSGGPHLPPVPAARPVFKDPGEPVVMPPRQLSSALVTHEEAEVDDGDSTEEDEELMLGVVPAPPRSERRGADDKKDSSKKKKKKKRRQQNKEMVQYPYKQNGPLSALDPERTRGLTASELTNLAQHFYTMQCQDPELVSRSYQPQSEKDFDAPRGPLFPRFEFLPPAKLLDLEEAPAPSGKEARRAKTSIFLPHSPRAETRLHANGQRGDGTSGGNDVAMFSPGLPHRGAPEKQSGKEPAEHNPRADSGSEGDDENDSKRPQHRREKNMKCDASSKTTAWSRGTSRGTPSTTGGLSCHSSFNDKLLDQMNVTEVNSELSPTGHDTAHISRGRAFYIGDVSEYGGLGTDMTGTSNLEAVLRSRKGLSPR
ncbi:hypothetical protein CYMTET_18719 [Cymbomonas tetramitiformis]|uniref:Uncharacterized protein n=1 Tax=Cymbomonas tetramitiformis TaxID=36881 RepID=A0AAE0L619_9CHLO|nr:hypothetical protein CYMTET_18719 [Cymbomonas tetramitiformis]